METPEGCPDCGSGLYRDGRCIVCAIRRMHEQHRQMRERSGPLYEQAAQDGIGRMAGGGQPTQDGRGQGRPHWR